MDQHAPPFWGKVGKYKHHACRTTPLLGLAVSQLPCCSCLDGLRSSFCHGKLDSHPSAHSRCRIATRQGGSQMSRSQAVAGPKPAAVPASNGPTSGRNGKSPVLLVPNNPKTRKTPPGCEHNPWCPQPPNTGGQECATHNERPARHHPCSNGLPCCGCEPENHRGIGQGCTTRVIQPSL